MLISAPFSFYPVTAGLPNGIAALSRKENFPQPTGALVNSHFAAPRL